MHERKELFVHWIRKETKCSVRKYNLQWLHVSVLGGPSSGKYKHCNTELSVFIQNSPTDEILGYH
jgi:hypothetical protein